MTAGKDARGKSLLTTREREVFELLVQDKTTKEIADTLFISEKTVRNHISNLMRTDCKPPPIPPNPAQQKKAPPPGKAFHSRF